MGSSSSKTKVEVGSFSGKMKIRPVHKPLEDGPTVSRIFTTWGPLARKSDEPLTMEIFPTLDIGKTTALFAIRYNPDDTGATEEIIINGHRERIPLSAAKALRFVFENSMIIRGLTDNWQPWYWMDCLCINPNDPAEAARQRKLEPWIYSIAKWTVDCTGPVPQIKLGGTAYKSAVVNFGGIAGDIQALGASVNNAQRLIGHVPGQVVWSG